MNLTAIPISQIISTTFPQISKSSARHEWSTLKRLLRRTSAIAAVWIAFCAVGMLILGPVFFYNYKGGAFLPTLPGMFILLPGFAAQGIFFWNRPLLLSLGKPNFPLAVNASLGAVKIGLMFLLVPTYGYLARQDCFPDISSSPRLSSSGKGCARSAGSNFFPKTSGSMKIACISPSRVPSRTANSIQAMKACHGLAQNGHEVRLFLPGEEQVDLGFPGKPYGLETEFQITWLPSRRIFRRYEFSLIAVSEGQRWGADVVYTWLPQAGLFGLERGIPSILEVHDRLKGSLGPVGFCRFCRHRGRKRLAVITNALLKVLENENGIQPAAGEVVITPNGVEWERFANQPCPKGSPRKPGIEGEPNSCLFRTFLSPAGVRICFFPLLNACRISNSSGLAAARRISIIGNIALQAEKVQNVVLTGFVENSRLPLHLAAAEVLMIPFERRIEVPAGVTVRISAAR